jgi:hypothetical protein
MGTVYYFKTSSCDLGLLKKQDNRWVLQLPFVRHVFHFLSLYPFKEPCNLLTSRRGKQIQVVPLCLPVLLTKYLKGGGRVDWLLLLFSFYFLVPMSKSSPFWYLLKLFNFPVCLFIYPASNSSGILLKIQKCTDILESPSICRKDQETLWEEIHPGERGNQQSTWV